MDSESPAPPRRYVVRIAETADLLCANSRDALERLVRHEGKADLLVDGEVVMSKGGFLA
jgi:hypothetical protein